MGKLQVFTSSTFTSGAVLALMVLVLCAPEAWGWRSFKIIFTEFPYTFNSDLVDVKGEIANITGETSLNLVMTFNKDTDDVFMNYAIALETSEDNYTTLVNHTLNFCEFLKQPSMEPLMRLVYEDLIKESNFITLCPIRKGIYTIHEYRINEEMLPSYVPETSFYFELKLGKTKSGDSFFSGRLNGKIDKSKGFNNLKMFSLG